MKHIYKQRSLILILILSPFLVQCFATTQDLRTLELRIRTVNSKIQNIDRSFDDLEEETTSRANKTTVDTLQKHQANTANTLDDLKTEVLMLRGEIEESTHSSQKLREDAVDYRDNLSNRFHDLTDAIENIRANHDELGNKINDLEKRVQDNEQKTDEILATINKQKISSASKAAEKSRQASEDAARAAVAAHEAKLKSAEKSKAAEKARRAKTGKPHVIEAEKTKKAVGRLSTGKASSGKTAGKDPAQLLFDSGVAAFTAKKFQDAYAAFTNYIDKYPKGSMIARARFWMADSLYNQKEYELAILEYQKVIADYPKDKKAPSALLKQGLAFEKLKDMETAKLVYYKLSDDYPSSKEAATAQKRLQKIK